MLASLVAELLPVQIAEQPSELGGVYYTRIPLPNILASVSSNS